MKYLHSVVFVINSAQDEMDLKKNREDPVRDFILVRALDTAAELDVRVLARAVRSVRLLEQSAMAGFEALS